MDTKDALHSTLEVINDLKRKALRPIVTNLLLGIETPDIKNLKLDEHDLFGTVNKDDADDFNTLLDQAIADKFIKCNEEKLSVTPKGNKFLSNPVPYVLRDKTSDDPDMNAMENNIELLDGSLIPAESKRARSAAKIELIQAIDRKVALDDFAEQHNMEFSDLLDELEGLMDNGRKLDISYFVEEVLGDECLEELNDFFGEVDGDMEKAVQEYDDVYAPEEIRLAHIIWTHQDQ